MALGGGAVRSYGMKSKTRVSNSKTGFGRIVAAVVVLADDDDDNDVVVVASVVLLAATADPADGAPDSAGGSLAEALELALLSKTSFLAPV